MREHLLVVHQKQTLLIVALTKPEHLIQPSLDPATIRSRWLAGQAELLPMAQRAALIIRLKLPSEH